MTATIWKFPLNDTKKQVIVLPAGARLLTVATQHNVPNLWVEVDPEKGMVPRKILIRGTGHEMGEATGCPYIGTVLLLGDQIVWHVFDGGEMPQ